MIKYSFTLLLLLLSVSQSHSKQYEITHNIKAFQNISETTNDNDCLYLSFSATSQITYKLTVFTSIVFQKTSKMFAKNFDYLENAPYTSYFINNNPFTITITYILEKCQQPSVDIKVIILIIIISLLICYCIWCIILHYIYKCYHLRMVTRRSSNVRLLYYQSLSSQSSQSPVSSSYVQQHESTNHLHQNLPNSHQ